MLGKRVTNCGSTFGTAADHFGSVPQRKRRRRPSSANAAGDQPFPQQLFFDGGTQEGQALADLASELLSAQEDKKPTQERLRKAKFDWQKAERARPALLSRVNSLKTLGTPEGPEYQHLKAVEGRCSQAEKDQTRLERLLSEREEKELEILKEYFQTKWEIVQRIHQMRDEIDEADKFAFGTYASKQGKKPA
ncbi:MAG: hypothetical protein Q9208_004488 [Pyrenodesmia sp. 3 TL-2023]